MAAPHHSSSATQFKIDMLAIAIAMALAVLIRLNILPQIKF
jgi:hypothetical protein